MLQRVRPRSIGDNVSDEARLSALEGCTAAYRTVEEVAEALKAAKKEFSAELKKWKERGINIRSLQRAIKDRYTEENQTLDDLHQYIRFRSLQNMPTIQQSLLDLWAPIDLPEERKAEVERTRWREDGAFAGRQKQDRSINPHQPGSEAFQAWDAGWLEDPERIADAMARGEAPQPAAA